MAIKTSDLDYQNIKSSLKTYLQKSGEFNDYNFEASGLSSILDVLAYNTHLNGLTANLAINESFLSSAQLRGSVVGHAETLGYYPKSRTAAVASVNLSVDMSSLEPSARPASVTLFAGTEFTGEAPNQVTYRFITTEDYVAVNDNGVYVFKTSSGSSEIPLVQGVKASKTFYVDGNVESSFVIPDETIDVPSLSITVYDNFTSLGDYKVYDNINNVVTVTPDSTVYMVREAANGYFEVFFSDGNILGKRPVSGNKVVMEYMTSKGAVANGVEVFQTVNLVNSFPINVTTVSPSAGGSAKESMASIKLNAPRAFATQQRLVTAEDYRSLILTNYGEYITDVATWGGHENIPPMYGKVFASLDFRDVPETVKTQVQQRIADELTANLSIMSIDTVFISPKETNLELQVTFNFDPAQTGSTAESLESQVIAAVRAYASEELSTFNKVFRRSNVLAVIDDLSPAILNSRMVVKANQKFDEDNATTFPFALAIPDAEEYTVLSSTFDYLGTQCRIRNELGTNRLQLIDPQNNVRLNNIGSYEPATGVVRIVELDAVGVSVTVTPANQSTLRPLRNYIINVDRAKSFASASVDNQVTRTVL